ncbi:bifunctional lytic transglycosylase/C40 family peptidase [Yinghuangia sp. KLBMP8922]|uniref:Bifunctional lytic transglycosylase/C40 family peptidase n=1 Tax=Yinghuangia soli TaxID=2908204 RepID=A0AA41PVU5_9ACTN|nr:bifunctional lytic transglycosylase/C40 family peptidase [Yinghuangia soli]MCF2526819.1 bifunctional lytic transglycosylase/C40 family peptidase [Yinghuangia soli]
MRKVWLAGGLVSATPFALLGLVALGIGALSGFPSAPGGSGAVALAPGAVPAAYQPAIERWGRLCPDISPALLAAQLYQESGFDPKVVSPVGAQGIAQFMPGTWPQWSTDGDGDGRRDPFDPDDAIPSAAKYDCALSRSIASVPGDRTNNMLAAYNAGAYRVMQYKGIPPYTETRNYVKNIRSLEQSFGAVKTALPPSVLAVGAIEFAQSKLGTPYLWGGEGTAAQGGRFDCSGLTQAAYEKVGIKLPRVANDQWNAGRHPVRAELLPGDLVFFANDLRDPRSIHHVGIYVGGGTMIHAPYTGEVIRFGKIDKPDYIGATRVTPEGAEALPVRGPGAVPPAGAGAPQTVFTEVSASSSAAPATPGAPSAAASATPATPAATRRPPPPRADRTPR